MQTQYKVNQDIAIEGQRHGADHRSRPGSLPWLPQITQGTIANGEAGDWVFTVVDDLTGQSYSLTVQGDATEATALDNLVAGWRAHGKLNDLFSIAEDGSTKWTVTARHANRSYTITSTPPGSMTDTIVEVQAPGGSGLAMGRAVARASSDGEIQAMQATTVLSEVAGVLVRTEANHFHSLENDTPDAIDMLDRGKTYPVMFDGYFFAKVEEAVTPADRVYIRRALTNNTGRLGGFRKSPAGGQQVVTVTPTEAELDFAILIEWIKPGGEKESVPLISANPDGSATATEICDAFRVAAATAQADGVLAGFTFGGTETLTITGPAGQSFTVADIGEGVAAVAETTPADVDAIDASSKFTFESSAAADGLALVRVCI